MSGPFQTIEYCGYWLHCQPSRVRVQEPGGRTWQHDYSSLAGAKAAVRAAIAKGK